MVEVIPDVCVGRSLSGQVRVASTLPLMPSLGRCRSCSGPQERLEGTDVSAGSIVALGVRAKLGFLAGRLHPACVAVWPFAASWRRGPQPWSASRLGMLSSAVPCAGGARRSRTAAVPSAPLSAELRPLLARQPCVPWASTYPPGLAISGQMASLGILEDLAANHASVLEGVYPS